MNEQNEFSDEENFKFFGLGGCNEVGRSCHIIEYKNKVIMLDSGMHPALSGHASFPYFDEYDISKVDIKPKFEDKKMFFVLSSTVKSKNNEQQ